MQHSNLAQAKQKQQKNSRKPAYPSSTARQVRDTDLHTSKAYMFNITKICTSARLKRESVDGVSTDYSSLKQDFFLERLISNLPISSSFFKNADENYNAIN